jgi:hypothetical protein
MVRVVQLAYQTSWLLAQDNGRPAFAPAGP